jgi:tetratricopeptide (TPR) repeat protein
MKLARATASGLVFTACLALSGCAGHAAKTLAARSALDAGDPRGALKALNDVLEVSSEKDVPEKTGGDNALFLLDRAMVLQQLDQYSLSSRDLEISDKQIEVLDLSANAVADIGRYLFSDDTGPYKAPAYEKLMINTMNMMNYLARSDLNGARVEARRLAVMQKYTRDTGDKARALLGPGSYLAGFVFEKSGKPDEALRYYDEALEYGQYASLAGPVRRLMQDSSYSSPRIRELLSQHPPAGETPKDDDGELLVIVNFGRVPAKYAKRIPIGLALTYASGAISPFDQERANKLALQGLVTWVNYPELGRPRGTWGQPSFRLDQQWADLEGIVAVDQEAARAWDDAKGAIIASAITRTITRVVAGEGTKAIVGGKDGSSTSIIGELLSLGVQATLTATDTPDTRNWSTLPARIAFGRVRVRPGTHVINLNAAGGHKQKTVTIEPGGWAVVDLTALN